MADVRVASGGDVMPLLDDAGGGVYSVGRNTASDIRNELLSAMFVPTTSAFVVRTGVLARSYSSGYNSLQVTQNSTPNRFVNVAAGISVHTRTGQAAYLAHEPATVSIQAPAANSTNPRIDLVVKRVYDKAYFPGDSFHGPYIEVIEGVAASTPAAPSVPDGAVALAELARDAGSAGDTITTAKITDRRQSTGLAGTPRILLPGDSAATAGNVPGEMRRRLVGGTLLPPEMWGTDSLWHGTQELVLPQPAGTSVTHLGGVSAHTMAAVSIADPGWPYYIRAAGAGNIQTDPFATTTLSGVYMQINVDDQTFNPTPSSRRLLRSWGGTMPMPQVFGVGPITSPTTYTGSHTAYLVLYNDSSPSNFLNFTPDSFFHFSVSLIPA